MDKSKEVAELHEASRNLLDRATAGLRPEDISTCYPELFPLLERLRRAVASMDEKLNSQTDLFLIVVEERWLGEDGHWQSRSVVSKAIQPAEVDSSFRTAMKLYQRAIVGSQVTYKVRPLSDGVYQPGSVRRTN